MSPEEQPLRATLAISNAEAITGTNRTLNLPSGQQVRVFVPAGAYDGQVIRLENQGEPTSSGGSTITLIFTLTVAQVEETYTSSNVGSDEQTVRASRSNLQEPITPGPQGVPLYPPPPPQQPPVYVPPYYPPSPSIPAFTPMNDLTIPPSPSGSHAKTILLIVLIFLIIISGVGLFYIIQTNQTNQTGPTSITTTAPNSNLNATSTAQANAATVQVATATAQANTNATANAAATATIIAQNPDPYPPNTGTLVLYDPLTQPSPWDNYSDATFGGACQFSNGAYHASQSKPNRFFHCNSLADPTSDLSNFAFEAQMTIIKGDCGGIVFREDTATSKFYFFRICQDESYSLFLYANYAGTNIKTLRTNASSAIHKGLNQSNVIAVVANGGTLNFYVNKQKIDSISDSTYSHGQIGIVASAFNNPTEVVYNNAKVWRL